MTSRHRPTESPSQQADRSTGSSAPGPDRRGVTGSGRGSRILSISWVPIVVSKDPSVRPCPWDFYIGQTVLREVQTRILAKGDRALGLLIGKVREPNDAGSAYVVVDQFLPSLESVSEDASEQQVARMLRPLQEAASLAGRTVVGWYRGHADLGLELSEVEERFHADRFPAPWQFALLGIGDMERPVGAVFARNGAGELAPSTFHELLESRSILGGGRKRTVLEWLNYGTTDRVVSSDGREIPRPPGALVAQPGPRSSESAVEPAAPVGRPRVAPEPDEGPAGEVDVEVSVEESEAGTETSRGASTEAANDASGRRTTSDRRTTGAPEGRTAGAPGPRSRFAAGSEEAGGSGTIPLVLPEDSRERVPIVPLFRRPALLAIVVAAALLLAGLAWYA